MKIYKSKPANLAYFMYRLSSPIVDPLVLINGLINYPKYLIDLYRYSRLSSEKIKLINTFPVLSDRLSTTPFDRHYFYQDIWAANKIFNSKVRNHIDVGSKIDFVGFLSTFTKVTFVDIRPLKVNVKNLKCLNGSILDLPFKTNSQSSISCLHVAEHIGLGRYGDPLDSSGTKKACAELYRVLAKRGKLYFSVPVGKPKLCFNAHRIHSSDQILEYFKDLKLVELSGITDSGKFIENINKKILEKSHYACGLFVLEKK